MDTMQLDQLTLVLVGKRLALDKLMITAPDAPQALEDRVAVFERTLQAYYNDPSSATVTQLLAMVRLETGSSTPPPLSLIQFASILPGADRVQPELIDFVLAAHPVPHSLVLQSIPLERLYVKQSSIKTIASINSIVLPFSAIDYVVLPIYDDQEGRTIH